MRALIVLLVLLPVSAGLLGCEENLAPREPFGRPFSLYGVLSPDLPIQSIRLYPLEDFISLGSPKPPEVDVASTDLHTGERRTWRDTVLVDPNGQHEYIFWSPFRAEFGHTYRVEAVRRSDGATSHAEVRIPPPVRVRLVDDRDASALQVLIEGENIRALKPEAEYAVRAAGALENDTSTVPIFHYVVSYEGRERAVEQGWQVNFNMVVDFGKLVPLYSADIGGPLGKFCEGLALYGLELHVLVGDAVWDPPGGVFDFDILVHPQTLSNVENGFGFIGGGYRVAESVFPSREAVEYACFVYVW